MGKTTAEVMPPLTFWQRMRTIPDSIAFSALDIIGNFIVMVFFVGDVLMSARLIIVGLFAVIDRFRKPFRMASPGFNPRVAVLIPAYNEETVIVRTIRSVLNSDYTNLHVIVIDDGSSDRTPEVAASAFAKEIKAGRVKVLTKRNEGKAAALNYALGRMTEEIFVGIDADTVIAPDAISKLIPHFEDPESAQSPATPRLATASISGPAGRPSNTSPARTSSAALSICSTSSPLCREPSARGAPLPSKRPVAIRSTPSPKTPTSP